MEQIQEINVKEPSIKERFLREFLVRLISLGFEKEILREKIRGELKGIEAWHETPKQLFMHPQIIAQPAQLQQIRKVISQMQPVMPPKQGYIQSIMHTPLNQPPRQMPPPKAMAVQEYIPSIASSPSVNAILPKITQFFNDPSIFSVECSGPGKSLLVNRYGSIQPAQTILTADEIKSVLQEISNKTRIPLITGAFKAFFDNLICTAVISEYVGSRFIIQRKPVQQMPTQPFR